MSKLWIHPHPMMRAAFDKAFSERVQETKSRFVEGLDHLRVAGYAKYLDEENFLVTLGYASDVEAIPPLFFDGMILVADLVIDAEDVWRRVREISAGPADGVVH